MTIVISEKLDFYLRVQAGKIFLTEARHKSTIICFETELLTRFLFQLLPKVEVGY